MPPKGKEKQNSKKTNNNCIFQVEILCYILSRLPVKTLLRFRSVCKQWRKLISKPDFIADHSGIAKNSCSCSDNSQYWLHNISLVFPFELFLHSISDLRA
ncbi:hypothetical protein K7X08_033047 [Anisodus acutangulus]|uniref:F-box domain-containing protein n=1 Tax=Anisodus acutangulus TaxID=402998 RepID=A0A9Q1M1Z1_9SOLA|nr:hypothetical protein K7X08_033047 [Anisodus acutangulus]